MIDFGFWGPILIAAGVNVILTLGLYVTTTSGQLSIAHAALFGVGAYVGAILTTNFHWAFLPAIAAGALAAAVLGGLIALVTLPMNLLVQSLATLGFGQTLSIVAYNIKYIGGANSFTGMPYYTTTAWVVAGVIFAAVVVWFFDRSLTGFAARAMRDNVPAAAACGVNIGRMRVLTYAAGGLLAGLAGVISAHYTLVINPGDLAFFQSFTILIYLLFGGSYSMWGAIVGSVALTVLPQAFRFALDFRFVLYGLAIVLIVLLRPEGLIRRRGTRPARRGLRLPRRAAVAGD